MGSKITTPPAYHSVNSAFGSLNVAVANTFQDLDLSSVVGVRKARVMLKVSTTWTNFCIVTVRRNGDTDVPPTDFAGSTYCIGCNLAGLQSNGSLVRAAYVIVDTDASGLIEWTCTSVTPGITFTVMSFVA